MPNYHNSIIYKIYDNTNGDVYYGSTCNLLRVRIRQHKSDATSVKARVCKSKCIILNDNYDYSVVEKFPCETKEELHVRERWYIENNACVNKQVPGRTQKESDDDRYYNNKEYEKQRARDYYNNHKEAQSARSLKYHNDNIEVITQKRKVRIECECGVTMQKYHLPKHKTTKQHIEFMALCHPCPRPS